VDAVYDLVGGESLRELAELLPDRSRLISGADRGGVGDLGGAPVLRVRKSEVLDTVARLVVDGVLDPFVTRSYPFAEADRALRAIEDGHVRGKLVIEVSA
jgi:NADPH:quinone reductase-like Zn-dependent oxidoreductase